MHVAGVTGPSDAGKTSLVERLVPSIAASERVATLKSIHHDVEPDDTGTDTHRHRTAGAASATGITPSLTFEVREGGKGDPVDPTAAARALEGVLRERADDGMAVTLVEGFQGSRLPTVLVGDVTPGDVAGPVIARAGNAATADIVTAIRGTRSFDTPASVLARLVDDAPCVAVIGARIPADGPVSWTDDAGGPGSLTARVRGEDGVTRVIGGRRPSVEPSPTHAHAAFGVAATNVATARRAIDIVRDDLAARGAEGFETRGVS